MEQHSSTGPWKVQEGHPARHVSGTSTSISDVDMAYDHTRLVCSGMPSDWHHRCEFLVEGIAK